MQTSDDVSRETSDEDDPEPAVCRCGFWSRDACLYVKYTRVCDWPSSYPPRRRPVSTFTRRPNPVYGQPPGA